MDNPEETPDIVLYVSPFREAFAEDYDTDKIQNGCTNADTRRVSDNRNHPKREALRQLVEDQEHSNCCNDRYVVSAKRKPSCIEAHTPT